jgi:predicted HAD superfamily Cof-like phosphohydrolase
VNTNDRVREFHEAFNHPVATRPTIPPANIRRLRIALIAEELKELADASGVPFTYEIGSLGMVKPSTEVDIVEAADACGDLDYVVQGTNVVWGFPAEEIAIEVHRSNMSKLGRDGKPIYREDAKVLKGPSYRPPDVKSIIERHTDTA